MSAVNIAGLSDEQLKDEDNKYERDRYEKLLLEATNLAREITDVFYRDAALHQLIKPLTAAGDEIQAKSCFRLLRWILFKTQSLRNTPVWALDFDCGRRCHTATASRRGQGPTADGITSSRHRKRASVTAALAPHHVIASTLLASSAQTINAT